MLLINRKLIRLALPSAGWILARVAVKLLLIVSIMLIYRSISGVQGQLYEGSLTIRELKTALLTMSLVAVLRFLGNLIDGELGYQCASRTRLKLRSRVYQKLLELEVGYSEITGTSNVDSENEEDIWDCIHSLDGQKTVIIITHRLSTIRRADQICVIEHGSITESGSYDELGRGHGLFARLLTEQAELERFGVGGITA